jgi:hypothetical protein
VLISAGSVTDSCVTIVSDYLTELSVRCSLSVSGSDVLADHHMTVPCQNVQAHKKGCPVVAERTTASHISRNRITFLTFSGIAYNQRTLDCLEHLLQILLSARQIEELNDLSL